MKKSIFLLMILIFIYNNSYSLFEKSNIIGIGARPASLGGAYSALADDINSIFYNPAGLYKEYNLVFNTIYGNIVNTKESLFGFGISNNFFPNFSIALTNLTMKKDFNYENISIFTLSLPFIRDLYKELSFGVNVKYLSVFYSKRGNAIGFDVGLLYKMKNFLFSKSTNFGIFIQDCDTKIRWEDGREEKTPCNFSTGISYQTPFDVNINIDINISNNFTDKYKVIYKTGIEKIFDVFSLRVGYTGFDKDSTTLNFGISAKIPYFIINYAYVLNTQNLGNTHIIDGQIFFNPLGEVLPPYNVIGYNGDRKAYIKWMVENPELIEKYKIYISDDKNNKVIKVVRGGRNVNFLITELENYKKYHVKITCISKEGIESNYSKEIEIIPHPFKNLVSKTFYKKSKILYINKKYKEALYMLNRILEDKNADVIILRERIKNILNIGEK